jgi:hypothetical protein
MKRILAAIITGLFLSGFIVAQSGEMLTNNAIAKMVKARLSDELIIDVISTSPAKFDLDDSSLKSLTSQGVSTQVIEAMKTPAKSPASADRGIVPEQKQTVSKSVPEISPKEKPKGNSMPPAVVKQQEMVTSPEVVDAPGYIVPVKELVTFYENGFKSMDDAVSEWDKLIRNSIGEANNLDGQILEIEAEL